LVFSIKKLPIHQYQYISILSSRKLYDLNRIVDHDVMIVVVVVVFVGAIKNQE